MNISKKCKQCGEVFIPSEKEVEALKKFDAAPYEECADCRNRRRLIFRNERKIFRKVSDKSGKRVVSTYPEGSPFKILDQDEWWSDEFDATVYGQDFDFGRPFLEQFRELQLKVPRWARMFVNCENSDYTNNSVGLKNSYLTFSSYDSEQLYYCMRVMSSNYCVDCLNVRYSEFCSNCVECKKCYGVHYSQMAEGCRDSFYLYDCRNCSDCILSAQMRNKKYMILNKQYSREEYEKLKGFFFKKLADDQESILILFENLKKKILHRALWILGSENSIGDFINDSKNVENGFYVSECEDCVNLYDCHKNKDCFDNLANEKSELAFECDTAYELYNVKFCSYTVIASDATYCDQCINVKNCFGCVGLKKEQYVILNKKYSKNEYEEMMVKIEKHLRETGEYGKPFPSTLSTYPYNLSAAQINYPLKKAQALAQGYRWYEEEEGVDDGGNIADEAVLICEVTGKKYRIIAQEADFYKKFNLPLPRICPEERYQKRSLLMRPKKLLDSACSICGSSIKTVYSPESGYKIVCEKCYVREVF